MLYTMYKNKRPLRLYIIPLALSVILFTHLGKYIPVIRTIHPDTYTYFFIFLIAFMFIANLKMKIPFKKLLIVSLIPIAISFMVVSEMFIPHFSQPSQIDNEVVSLMPYITDRVIISVPPEFQRESPNVVSWSGGYYAYGAIYYNLSTPSGHFFELAKPKDLANINELEQKVSSLSCTEIIKSMNALKATQIIVYYDTCNKLSSCSGYELLKSADRACLYSLTS
jgi:hypothetical protein